MQHQRQRHDSPHREVPRQPQHAAPAAVVDARECEVVEVRYLASQDWPDARRAARASPSAMRYQAKTSNERCDTKRMSHRTTTSALANATTKPVARIRASDPDNRWRFSQRSRPVAANITGMASRNENSAAA